MSNVSAGIFFMLLSSLSFATMNGFAKALSQAVMPAMENVFFRSFTMIIIVLAIYVVNFSANKEKKKLKSGGWGKLCFRVLMGGLAMVAVFYNIATIPLGTATAFAQSVPLYTAVMGMLFLKEKNGISVIIATIIGFVGILLISNPDFNGISFINIAVGIFSGFSMAIAFITLKTLKPYFDNQFLILAFGVGTALLGAIGMLLPLDGIGGFVMPQTWEYWLIIGMGASGTVAQYFLNKAYITAPVGIVAPIDYSRIVFSLFIGIFLGDELPHLMNVLGILLIIISGILIAMPSLLDDIRKIKNNRKL